MSQMMQVTPLWVDGKPFHDSADGKLQIPSNRVVKVVALVNGTGGIHPGVNSAITIQKLYKSNIFNTYEVRETLAQLTTTSATIMSTSGPQGPVGPTGSPGPAGPAGPAGSNGAPGTSGAAGLNGTQGAVGAVGPQGLTGQPGAIGSQGVAGAAGPIGLLGPQGPVGANGNQGIQGLLGSQGNTGATGPAGVQGPSGPSGPAGHGLNNRGAWVTATTYNTGDYVFSTASASTTVNSLWVSTFSTSYVSNIIPKTDLSNWQELPGLPGPTGTTGPQGNVGIQGPVGATGSIGAQGPAGIAGVAGSSGIAGPIGPTGLTGATGGVGPIGPQGGIGTQGPQGNQGIQGAQGPAGTTGPQGPSVYIDTLATVCSRGASTTTPMNIGAFGAAPDPYGVFSITAPANTNSYTYYSMTRAGQVAWGIGIDNTNRLFFGYGGTENYQNAGATSMMSVDNLGNVVIAGTLTVTGAIQSPRFYT